MAYDVVIVNNHPVHSNLKQFICTTADDISSLPTSITRGTQETTDDSINEPVAIGSAAYLADGSAIYNLSADNTWVQQTIVSGGGTTTPYAIVKNNEAEEGSASTYRMVQIDEDGNYIELENSATINIPKDMVVESGEVKECTEDNVPVEGYVVGNKYIDLVLANSDDQHLYINVSDLIDVHDVGKKYGELNGEIFNDYTNNIASGEYSHAEGKNTTASSEGSHAEGINTKALGPYAAHAEGEGTVAAGYRSHAEGYHGAITVGGQGAHIEGMSRMFQPIDTYIDVNSASSTDIETAWNTNKFHLAANQGCHVEGVSNLALEYAAHAEGSETKATAGQAHSEGYGTTASGYCSHAEGCDATASGIIGHAEGHKTHASGKGSHAEGISTNTASSQITITDTSTNDEIITAWNSKKFSLAKGEASHVEGKDNLALGSNSHAEGNGTRALGDYSHAEGSWNEATGNNSHVEGSGNVASGGNSHAEGETTKASAGNSHAEGNSTEASGASSHAEGSEAVASGYVAHAEGEVTKASGDYSHAEGQNTMASGDYAHIEGKSTNHQYSLTITDTSTNDEIITAWNSKKFSLAKGEASHVEGKDNLALSSNSHAEGYSTIASQYCSHAEGERTQATNAFAHAEGSSTTASGTYSHAEGNNTTASNAAAHAEGMGTTASGAMAHAEGNYTTASGYQSHAEGMNTTAYGGISHAEGHSIYRAMEQIAITDTTTNDEIITAWETKNFSLAKGEVSHVEGRDSLALGKYSHAEGQSTIAGSDHQHAQGKYNVADNDNKYAFIIGNGEEVKDTETNVVSYNRSNAFAIDWDGKIYINNATEGIDLVDLVNRITALEAAAATTE